MQRDPFEVVRECFVGRAGEGERSVLRRLKNRFREEERCCFDEAAEEEVVGRETICMGEIEFIRDCFSSSVNGEGVC